MSNLQTYYNFKLDFQNLDQQTGGKWLIHGTKRRRAISCKAWNSPVEYPSRECKNDILWLKFMTHRTWKTSIIFTGFDHSLRHYQITASGSSVIYTSSTRIWRAFWQE